MTELETKTERLLETIRSLGSCAVAFSAGLDSTVVAKAAQLALGEKAVAVTGTSASLAGGELDQARELARLIGIRHEVIATGEFANPDYVRNAADRCYHCKTDLYLQMDKVIEALGVAVVVNGETADDADDYRPGKRAAAEQNVRSPLAECGLVKSEIRALAAKWELPIWDKPATPCLASRLAYGVEVTPERLEMIDRAERHLRALGLRECRIRYHEGDLARVEVPAEAIERLCRPERREQLVEKFKSVGFKFVTIDLEGFRSGSMNTVLPLTQLELNK